MGFDEFKPFLPLIIFGNIENLVLSSQGVIAGVNPLILAGLSLMFVIFWLLLGTLGTKVAIKYADLIEFIGGFAIFVLGLQAMLGALGIL
ncbi:hypothetical protein [uncultured Methanobrevibacter sp.]|uniref:hypothetical protein n=1 Tax=uncultured Methanobrevibacter sp. TaxID=253161 RepID=UPI0025EAD44B|nr:hypothetical protein [uncultured Methanobrevibacter sp.]